MLARRRPRTRQQMMGRRSRSRVPASRARGWRHLKFGSTERKSNAPDSATLVRHSVPFRKILAGAKILVWGRRSEEHTSELQSLMRISYAVFCLKKKNVHTTATKNIRETIV